MHLVSDSRKPRLTLVNYPTGYILKPQVAEFEALPESEQLIMTMADMAGISTVPHALIKGNAGLAYITKRVDRNLTSDKVEMLAMEDFCQLDLRLTEDKYRGSYERCAKIIKQYSSRVGIDMAEFYIRLVFCFIVGNSDMHLKNFSLIETAEGSGEYVLSPAYDLLPVNANMPADKEELLSAIGIVGNLMEQNWMRDYECIKAYVEEHHQLPVHKNSFDLPDGGQSTQWITNRRTQMRDGTMLEERVKMLADIGIVYGSLADNWRENYNAIKSYLDEHGELPLKEASITLPTGSQSHWWIRNQTLMLHQGRQSEDKVKLLNEIGIV